MKWLVALLLWSGAAQAEPSWDRYQVLMWQERTVVQRQGLAALGFTGAKLRATGGVVDKVGQAALLQAGIPYYLENIATDFYAPYHRYTPGKAVTWLFDAAKLAFRTGDATALIRTPGLSDPAWLERVRTRLTTLVQAERGHHPLFYNLADEAGIGDLAAAWDADQSADSLAGFRVWLQSEYGTLAALNQEWGTRYPAWDAVQPELTTAAIERGDENFAAWSDFKAWMDVAFSRAVRAGTEAVHAADAAARSGLEGAQVPGWGGYDYTLLAPAVDVMEIYDSGNALDLATAFNPGLIPLRTTFGQGPRERHAAWRHLLHGGRGVVVWDDDDGVVQADGTPTRRGVEIGATIAAIDTAAPLLRTLRPDPDPVAVLYSPASFRVTWMLDRRAGDHDWSARDAEREYDDNAWRASRRVLLERLAALAVQPRLVSGPMLAGLWQAGVRVLFLPHAIALSDAEVAAIEDFTRQGGTVFADTEPGLFDGHGKRRERPPLPDVKHPEPVRMLGSEIEPGLLDALAELLTAAGAAPRAVLLGPDGARATGVEGRWFAGEAGQGVLALQAARPWGAPPHLTVRFGATLRITDVLHPAQPRSADTLEIVPDGIEPTILAFRP